MIAIIVKVIYTCDFKRINQTLPDNDNNSTNNSYIISKLLPLSFNN